MAESARHRSLKHRAGGGLRARGYVADALWVAAPPGLILPRDLPRGWGLLEVGDDGAIDMTRAAVDLECTERQRQRVLRDIAAAATRTAFSGAVQGVLPGLA